MLVDFILNKQEILLLIKDERDLQFLQSRYVSTFSVDSNISGSLAPGEHESPTKLFKMSP